MANELAISLGRRIKARREELKMSQGQLAAKVGTDAVNNQRVSDWERGVHKPNDRHMADIAGALEKPVSWFYGEGDEEPAPDLLAALGNGAENTQLDRIERKLDQLILRLEAGDYPDPPADLVSTPPGPKPNPKSGQQPGSEQDKDSLSGDAG